MRAVLRFCLVLAALVIGTPAVAQYYIVNDTNPTTQVWGPAPSGAMIANTDARFQAYLPAGSLGNASYIITNVTSNGTLFRLTLSSTLGMATGQYWQISNADSHLAVLNGTWKITYINSSTIDLQASTFTLGCVGSPAFPCGYVTGALVADTLAHLQASYGTTIAAISATNTATPSGQLALTAAQATAFLNLSTASLAGLESAWPGNTTTYRRGDGTWPTLNFTALGTGTAPAFTLGGTVSGGGNNVNNVIIGAVTPLAGSFTTLTATTALINSNTASIPSGGLSGFTFKTAQVDGSLQRWAMFAAGAFPINIINFFSSQGTLASPTASNSGDTVGAFGGLGYGSTGYGTGGGGGLLFVTNQAWTDANQGLYISVKTTPNNTASQTEAARFQASGGLSIGTTTDPGVGSAILNANLFGPNLGTDAAATDTTLCWLSGSSPVGKFARGSGTLGICLGTSGRQFKTAFAPMQAGLAELMKIPFQNFRYLQGYGDGGDRVQYGTTAQDVESVIPDLVRHDADGNAINYDSGALLFIGLRAIQELKADNDNIRAANDNLRACMDSWKCRLLGWK